MVQGVGFRYFVIQRARRLALSGWVKNLADGSVAAVVEGDRSGIEALIEELKVGPQSARVSDVRVNWGPFTGEFDSFDVAW
jgi:acylphosphatase